MTKAVFEKKKEKFVKFEILGHTNYKQAGEDIVCASVSSLSIFCINVLSSQIDAKVRSEPKKPFLSFEIKDGTTFSQTVLETFFKTLLEMEEKYPEHMKVEVKDDEN